MKRKGRRSSFAKKILFDTSKETPQSMQSVLFNPHQSDGSTSVVVPETPNSSPCPSSSLTTHPTFLSVMETPENELQNLMADNSTSIKPGILRDKYCKKSTNSLEKNSGSKREGDLSNNFDITPDLNLDKRKKLLSLLESEHSFTQSLRSQKTKNSSMVFGPKNDGKTRMELEERDIVSFGRGRKKRKSFAEIILPFDLNSSENLSNKLDMIKENKQKVRSVSSMKSTQANSRKALPTQQLKTNDDDGGKKNLTMLFDSEDVNLTPIRSNSQILMESTVHSIIDGLSTHLDETDGTRIETCSVKENQKVPGLSFKEFSTFGDLQSQARTGGTLPKDQMNRKLCDKIGKGEKAGISLVPSSNPADDVRKEDSDITQEELTIPQSALNSALQGIVAYVEVRMGSDNRSAVIKEQLKALGAEVRERLTADVTHVIFKDGSKSVFDRAMKRGLHLVSSLWVEACREKRQRISEVLFPSSSIESYMKPLHVTRLRKMRSMQPREFSEEEKLAAARVQRRMKTLKSQSSPSPAPADLQSLSPQHNSLMKEAVDSPLFGISHLLTPRRKNSGSSSSSEEEENNSGMDLPTNLNTPLAKRLYDWFVSPKTDSQKREQQGLSSRKEHSSLDSSLEDITFGSNEKNLGKGKVDTLAIDNIECDMNVGNKDVQRSKVVDLDHIQDDCVTDDNSNAELIEMPVRIGVKLSNTEIVNPIKLKDQAQNQAHISEPKHRRSSRISTRLTRHSKNNKKLALECGDSEYNDYSADSSHVQSHFESKSKLWSHVPEKSSDLEKCNLDCNADDIRYQALQRKSTSSEEEAISKINDMIAECVDMPAQADCKMNTDISQNNAFRVARSVLNIDNDKTVQEGVSDFPEGKPHKLVRDSNKRKLEVQASSGRETVLCTSKCKQKTYGHTVFRNNDKELSGDLHKKEGLCDKTYSLNENNFTFPESQMTSTLCSSQARGRKLLCVDVLEPSQDLIIPVTPDNHKRSAQDPYTGLEIKGSKTQRASQRNQKGSSSMPLPRNTTSVHIRKREVNFSSSAVGTNSSFIEEDILKLQLSTSSTQNSSFESSKLEDEIGNSSGDDSVFPESKILCLPRPRRSTDEFQQSKELKPKGRRKCKSKSGSHPSICLTSVHSKDRSSLIPIIKKLGSYEVTEQVNHSTTHVVCGEARRTLNLLFGIARGCWILDVSWLYQSLEMEAWAPEEPFELFSFCPGAKICRQQKENQGASYQQTLFSGVGSICVLEGCIPSSAHLRELLHLCGAVLVSSSRNANLVIGKYTVASGARGSIAQITHVSEKWALDSIQQHKIQPLADYKLS
ncbi:microcephalin-like isoform X2 [Panulirus ornatus]